MTPSATRTDIPPFPPAYRASGLLLHVTSLPSPYGIGDLGPAAFSWIDRLHDAGQRWWQALPVGPTGYGNSPYQSLSSFAGNGLLVSPHALISEGLLHPNDCEALIATEVIDYDAVIPFKHGLLQKAWKNFKAGEGKDLIPAYDEWCATQEGWLEDYALFRALKAKYHGAYYLEWPEELVERRQRALAEARRELASEMDEVRFAQFLLFRQAEQLKAHAHSKGVRLIGDLPFFVSPDSSDVWANPELFLLDVDLGVITPDVATLRDQFQVPGTRVLQFAFDGHRDNPYLPENFVPNTVVYTGTHDNAPSREWYEELHDDQRQIFWGYLKRVSGESTEAAPALMRLAWSSRAALSIAPLQDLLSLGKEARMNTPGRPSGNWNWRATEAMMAPPAFERLGELTENSRRAAAQDRTVRG